MFFKNWSLCRIWNPDGPELAKVLLVQTNFETPNQPSRKICLWIFVSSSELTLSNYYMTLALGKLCFYFSDWLEFAFLASVFWQSKNSKNCYFVFAPIPYLSSKATTSSSSSAKKSVEKTLVLEFLCKEL